VGRREPIGGKGGAVTVNGTHLGKE
jgi:hypothetical protein